jgi:hypothetical protein
MKYFNRMFAALKQKQYNAMQQNFIERNIDVYSQCRTDRQRSAGERRPARIDVFRTKGLPDPAGHVGRKKREAD